LDLNRRASGDSGEKGFAYSAFSAVSAVSVFGDLKRQRPFVKLRRKMSNLKGSWHGFCTEWV